jgi:hypothetical protein
MLKKKKISTIPKRASAKATDLRGKARANKGMGSGGGTRKHGAWNKNLAITMTRTQSWGLSVQNAPFVVGRMRPLSSMQVRLQQYEQKVLTARLLCAVNKIGRSKSISTQKRAEERARMLSGSCEMRSESPLP